MSYIIYSLRIIQGYFQPKIGRKIRIFSLSWKTDEQHSYIYRKECMQFLKISFSSECTSKAGRVKHFKNSLNVYLNICFSIRGKPDIFLQTDVWRDGAQIWRYINIRDTQSFVYKLFGFCYRGDKPWKCYSLHISRFLSTLASPPPSASYFSHSLAKFRSLRLSFLETPSTQAKRLLNVFPLSLNTSACC